jgi:hypothetical protein
LIVASVPKPPAPPAPPPALPNSFGLIYTGSAAEIAKKMEEDIRFYNRMANDPGENPNMRLFARREASRLHRLLHPNTPTIGPAMSAGERAVVAAEDAARERWRLGLEARMTVMPFGGPAILASNLGYSNEVVEGWLRMGQAAGDMAAAHVALPRAAPGIPPAPVVGRIPRRYSGRVQKPGDNYPHERPPKPAGGGGSSAGANGAYINPRPKMSNAEVRAWYDQRTKEIKAEGERMEREGVPQQQRAERLHEMRHDARMQARSMMRNPNDVRGLEIRDAWTYGNKNGPTFDELLSQKMSQGMSRAEALDKIIVGASRPDAGYHAAAGIKP